MEGCVILRNYGLAYILNLLEISPTSLAKEINVDRSLISKWKNGSRKIDIHSTYLDKIIDYLITKNLKLGIKSLENLFSKVYDIENIEELHLVLYLKKFIVDNQIYESNNKIQIEMKTKNLNTEINTDSSIFPVNIHSGLNNRKKCILDFLEFSLNLNNNHKITLIYCNSFNQCMTDTNFNKIWQKYISQLLSLNYKIDLILSSYKDINFLILSPNIILNNNLNIFYYSYTFNEPIKFTIHILESQCAMFGYNINNDENSVIYTSVYKDNISIDSYSSIAENIKNSSKIIFIRKNTFEYLKNSYNLNHQLGKYLLSLETNIFYYNAIPSHLFMSDELFKSVLLNSVDSKTMFDKNFLYFKKSKQHLIKILASNKIIYFCPIHSLKNISKMNKITYTSDNLLIDTTLTLTNEHLKKHIHSTVEFLKQHKNFEICLVTESLFTNSLSIQCLVKKNHFFCIFDQEKSSTPLISEDTSFVNTITDFIEKYFVYSPHEMKSKTSVSNILLNL